MAILTKTPEKRKTIELWDHGIENDSVELFSLRQMQSVDAIVCYIDNKTML